MTRRVRALLLTLCLLLQALATLLPAGVEGRAEQFGHALVHAQALGHHHHDATLQLDADEAVAHQHGLDGGQPPCLPAVLVNIAAAKPASAMASSNVPVPPSAELQGLLRPPRARVA